MNFQIKKFDLHLFFLLASLVAISACSGGKQTIDIEDLAKIDSIDSEQDTLHLFEEEVPVPKAVDELFDDFFFTFATDSRFQLQRIHFPLICREQDSELAITRGDWQQLNKFGQQEFYSVIYERDEDMELQKDTAVSKVSVEWVYLHDEYVETYNFRRIESKWILTDIEKNSLSGIPNGAFLSFYSKFVSDSTYQVNSIEFPLEVTYTEDGGDEYEEDTEITQAKWEQAKSDLPIPAECLVNIDYGQPYLSQNRKILLMEGASSGLYMKFKFTKNKGNWMLEEIEY